MAVVVFLYCLWITKIFRTSILFETNKFHHRGRPCSRGPGTIVAVAPSWFGPVCAA